jgi:tetratricopeptide (TPR) repeat protein
MFQGVIAGFLALVFGCGPGFGQSLPEGRCSVSTFESSADDALAACTAVLRRGDLTDAARAGALKIRGRALHRAGRLDDAIADYEAALQLAPDDAELHLRRGWTGYDKRDLNLVINQARQALNLNPEYAEAFDLIGAALAVSGEERFAEAKAAYDQAVRLDPARPMPRYHRFQLLKNSYPREALQEVEALLQLPASAITKPAAVDYSQKRTTFRIAGSLARASLLTTLGRLDEALQIHDRAILDDPDALTYAWRAQFNLTQSAPEKVVQNDLDQAFVLDPDFWFAHDLQGSVHFYSQRYEAAATEFAHALKQFPANGTIRWWHAMTLRKLGRTEEASVEAVSAFEVDPRFMFSKVHMLQARGYLPALAPNADPKPALDDAARACMLDQECS